MAAEGEERKEEGGKLHLRPFGNRKVFEFKAWSPILGVDFGGLGQESQENV